MKKIFKKAQSKNAHVILSVLLAFILVAASLTACGHSSSANYSSKGGADSFSEEAALDAPMSKMAVNSTRGDFAAGDEAVDYDGAEYETAAESSDGGDSQENITPEKIPEDRKLIRTVNLSFETTEFDTFIGDLQRMTTELGGYIESSDINGNANTNANRYAYFTLRIPKPQVDTFLDFAEGGANLTRKYENTQDITLRYHDTESRKKALKEEYDRLLELMAKAESVDAIISIEQRLSDIRYELDNYESDLRTFDNQVDYSTVNVDVSETSIYTPTPKTTFWGRVSSNLEHNIEDIVDAVTDFLVWFISSLPIFLFLALICGIGWLIIHTLIKLHSKKAAEKAKRMAGASNTSATKAEVDAHTITEKEAPKSDASSDETTAK